MEIYRGLSLLCAREDQLQECPGEGGVLQSGGQSDKLSQEDFRADAAACL